MLFKQTIKNLNRIRHIIQVMLKYGFEDVVTNTTLKNLVPKSRQLSWSRQNKPVFEYSTWERIRMAFEELGPTFIKFAQVLSNRPDIFPELLITELEKLQSEVPPFPYKDVQKIVARELGADPEEIFEYVIEKPLGSASMGQVHRARLKNGQEVVIKVRRPRIRQTIETDIIIMKEVVNRTKTYLEKRGITNLIDMVETFEKSIQKELDFNSEARNIEQFRNFYKDQKDFYVPKVYKDITTERLVVIEFVNGCRITDKEQLQKWGLNPEKIATTGFKIYLTQIFEFGFFHADPHPGNILIREDGVICLLDFGMVGKLTKSDKNAIVGVFLGMAQQDARRMAVNLMRLATEHRITDQKVFQNDLHHLIEDFANLDLEESNIAEMGRRLQKIIYDYRMRVPGTVFLIVRALTILEGIGKQLSPGLNAYEYMRPFGWKLLQEQFSIENISEEVSYRISNFDYFLRSFPIEVNDILKKLSRGRLHIETELTGYKSFQRKLDNVANRLVLGLIIGMLLIASSLSLNTGAYQANSPLGIPWISTIGFLIVFILSIMLLIASRNKD